MERYKPVFEERVAIGTTAGSTLFTLSTSNYEKAEKVFMTLRNSAITFSLLSVPTTDQGHNLAADSNVTLYGKGEIFGFKAAAATTSVGSTGAVVYVTGFEWIG